MSRQVVMVFYESLVSRASKNEQGEKPLFLLAALKCILENDELRGVSLLKLIHRDNVEKIRPYFDDLAPKGELNPVSSWGNVVEKREMYDQIHKFNIEKANVSTAFANLEVEEIKELISTLKKRLGRRSKQS